MSLQSLISVQRIQYEPYTGQDPVTGADGYSNPCYIHGRLAGGNTRFDSQEAVDQVADANLSSVSKLTKNSRVTLNDQSYSIVEVYPIVDRAGKIKFYNYLLKSYNNA